jgi:hypothetical protein
MTSTERLPKSRINATATDVYVEANQQKAMSDLKQESAILKMWKIPEPI